jgi:RND family efflux transporter MFP subunit
VLIVLIIFMLVTGDGQKQKIRQTRALITVDTTELSTYDYDVDMGYIGTLYAANEFAVNSKIAGRVIKMNYDIGDRVENGAIIALIDDTQYQLEYKQAQGKLDMELSKVEQKQMAIDLAEREFERNTALREEKVISESQLEKAQYDFERQKVTFNMDQASLANQETAVEISQLRLSYTKIKADWGEEDEGGNRVLAERFVDVGEIINTNKPIASIMEIGLLKAEIFVGEKEYPLFKIGMKVTIEVDAFPGESFEGDVERVAPFLNQQTRQAKVLILVKNKDMRLRPGMFARTNVTFSRREGVVMLPKECIMEWKNADGVYVYDDENKQVFFRRVTVGDVHENNIEILNANTLDMPVVNVGQHMVRHMMKVNHVKDVQKEEPPRKGTLGKKLAPKRKSTAKPEAKAKAAEKRAAAQKVRAEKASAQDVTKESSSTSNQQTPSGKTVDPAVQSQAVPPKEPEAEVKPSTEKGTEG